MTVNELRNGITYWRGTDWPQDFHNTYYEHELAAIRTLGTFDQQWWDRFYRVLWDWRAARGVGRVILDLNAQARFEALGKVWAAAIAPHLKDNIFRQAGHAASRHHLAETSPGS